VIQVTVYAWYRGYTYDQTVNTEAGSMISGLIFIGILVVAMVALTWFVVVDSKHNPDLYK
jgi:hypothetical protein